MKKLLYFIPAIIAVVFYAFLAFMSGFGAIHPMVWVAVLLLILSGIFMANRKWWGAFFGIIVGGLLIYMGTQYTGQIVNEMPIGIVLIAFYAIVGIYLYKKRQ